MIADKWFLWVCNNCGSTMKINKVANEEDYNRFKDCVCGHELQYKKDLMEDEN